MCIPAHAESTVFGKPDMVGENNFCSFETVSFEGKSNTLKIEFKIPLTKKIWTYISN
jgi:hypothetical protein